MAVGNADRFLILVLLSSYNHSILTFMSHATVIYPHQLFAEHPALDLERPVYLVEEPLFLTEFPVHNQKLLLHRLSLQAYKIDLESKGYKVTYLSISNLPDSAQVFSVIKEAGCSTLHIVDTTDCWLEKRITEASMRHDFKLVRYESPLFILPKNEAVETYRNSKKYMATFYKKMRTREKVLLEANGSPVGGSWSFDSLNRKKLPRDLSLPIDITYTTSLALTEALTWLSQVAGEHYGNFELWLPYTRSEALIYLNTFLTERLAQFGAYEDAMTTKHTRLFHSTLSPLLNIGLLTPREVIDAAIIMSKEREVPLASLEGFVRQIIGWREFIRAAYECDGSVMRTKNFWNHTRSLPAGFWEAQTGIPPVDTAIQSALKYGYNHHIERLMVLGNFMLLRETQPDHVYRWFMAMYIDAYDWVMVPNVYGMSQFADGGIFATKPYISGSNYIRKMSDFQSGSWEEIWTSLYWNFIETHRNFFSNNHRMSMVPKLLDKMNITKRNLYKNTATKYLSSE